MKVLLGPKQLLYILMMALIATVFGALFLYNANPVSATTSFYLKVLLVNAGFMGDALFAFLCIGYLYFILQKKPLAIQLLLQTVVLLLLVQLVNNINSNDTITLFFEANAIGDVANDNLQQATVSSHTAITTLLFITTVTATKNWFKISGVFIIAVLIIVSRYFYFHNNSTALLLGFTIAIVSYGSLKLFMPKVKLIGKPSNNNMQPNTQAQQLYSI